MRATPSSSAGSRFGSEALIVCLYEAVGEFSTDGIEDIREPDFERLYTEHAAALYGFLVYRTGDQALAEDLVSETYERALRARFRFDRRRGGEKTWLYAIALNLLRDRARRRSAEERALERAGEGGGAADDSGSGGFEGVERREGLGRALALLPEDEREAVALRFGADMTMPEIARATHQRLSTIQGRVYRGLKRLREELE
jgi:RNA polymerase sigma-70 factor (ECF subfamily)